MSNFRPKEWWILYIKSGVVWPSLSKVFLNFLKYFLLQNGKYSLFHSGIVLGNKEYLKEFVLQKYVPTEFVEWVSHVLFLRDINL